MSAFFYKFIMLKDNVIGLRALEPEDIETLYKWENNTDLWTISNILVPISKHQLTQFVQEATQDIYETKQLRLMIDLLATNETIGCIDLFDFDPFHKRAGVGILINDKENRGKNFASSALKLFTDYAFDFLSLHQLYCNITTDNEASIKLFTNGGFEIVSKKTDWIWTGKAWKDEFFLQLVKF